jgi:hypothetical protein
MFAAFVRVITRSLKWISDRSIYKSTLDLYSQIGLKHRNGDGSGK